MSSLHIKTLVIGMYSFNTLYAISNRNLPNMGNDLDSSLRKNIISAPSFIYEGIYPINQYGWYITRKRDVPLDTVKLCDQYFKVERYHSHETLNFAIFKIDLSHDDQKDKSPELYYLATQEDLEHYSHWVTSYAFIPPLPYASGFKNYSKPLSAISKIEKQENGYLTLGLGSSLKTFYRDVYPVIKNNGREFNLENYEYIFNLLIDSHYVFPPKYSPESEFEDKINYLYEKEPKDIDERLIKCGLASSSLELIKKIIEHRKELECELEKTSSRVSKNYLIEAIKAKKMMASFVIYSEINELNEFKDTKWIQCKKRIKNDDSDNMWWEYKKEELKEKQNNYLKDFKFYDSLPSLYASISEDKESKLVNHINNVFEASDRGVPDQEDHGGLILVPSKNLSFSNGRYFYPQKIAGITCVKKESNLIEGENSIAIDLTTPEVHDWISHTINTYYLQKEFTFIDLTTDDL